MFNLVSSIEAHSTTPGMTLFEFGWVSCTLDIYTPAGLCLE